jgi:Transposase DDE domain
MAVNIKSIKILSIKVTDEHVHGSKAVLELVENIIKYDDMTKTTTIIAIGKLFSDGTYEGNDIFRYLSTDNGILHYIKVRKIAKVLSKKGHILRNLSAISQKKDLQKWKEDSIVSYGQRWIVEAVFSSIKITFGE